MQRWQHQGGNWDHTLVANMLLLNWEMQENESCVSFGSKISNCALDPAQNLGNCRLCLKWGTFFPGLKDSYEDEAKSAFHLRWCYGGGWIDMVVVACFNLCFVTQSHCCEMSSHISRKDKAKLRNLNNNAKRMANQFDIVAKKTAYG